MSNTRCALVKGNCPYVLREDLVEGVCKLFLLSQLGNLTLVQLRETRVSGHRDGSAPVDCGRQQDEQQSQ
jgi:hypothetical protein